MPRTIVYKSKQTKETQPMGVEDGALLVLKIGKTDRQGDVKRYDIVRVSDKAHIDHALAELDEGEYIVVEPSRLQHFAVSYKRVQVNRPL